jgi:uncharacterized protein YqgC (DUF456 family)
MPILLIFIGIVLIDVAYQNTQTQFLSLVHEVIYGTNGQISYWQWAFALFIVAMFGYIKSIRPVVITFLILIGVVMIFSNLNGNTSGNIINTVKGLLTKLK